MCCLISLKLCWFSFFDLLDIWDDVTEFLLVGCWFELVTVWFELVFEVYWFLLQFWNLTVLEVLGLEMFLRMVGDGWTVFGIFSESYCYSLQVFWFVCFVIFDCSCCFVLG